MCIRDRSYSQDNDNANWQSIATLSAAVTSTQNQLTILNADESLADYSFRAFYQSDSYSCDPGAYTDPVQLYFTPLFIPNAFSPNGDGINDSWEIEGFEHFKSSEVTIYNRWGVVVYKASDYQNNWNGTTSSELQKSFTKLPNDTYFYVLILGDRQYKGYVYLRR